MLFTRFRLLPYAILHCLTVFKAFLVLYWLTHSLTWLALLSMPREADGLLRLQSVVSNLNKFLFLNHCRHRTRTIRTMSV